MRIPEFVVVPGAKQSVRPIYGFGLVCGHNGPVGFSSLMGFLLIGLVLFWFGSFFFLIIVFKFLLPPFSVHCVCFPLYSLKSHKYKILLTEKKSRTLERIVAINFQF